MNVSAFPAIFDSTAYSNSLRLSLAQIVAVVSEVGEEFIDALASEDEVSHNIVWNTKGDGACTFLLDEPAANFQ